MSADSQSHGAEEHLVPLPGGKPATVQASQRLGQQVRLELGIDGPLDDLDGPSLVRDLAVDASDLLPARYVQTAVRLLPCRAPRDYEAEGQNGHDNALGEYANGILTALDEAPGAGRRSRNVADTWPPLGRIRIEPRPLQPHRVPSNRVSQPSGGMQ